MQKFYINAETFSKCGICADVCPALIIEKENSTLIHFKDNVTHLCVGCGQCMAVCKTKSIFSNGMTYENDFFEFSDNKDFLSILEHRRSVRRFKPKPVSKEKIKKILYAISLAPHGDSHHHVEITIINDRNKIVEALPLMSHLFYYKIVKWLKNPILRYFIEKEQGRHTLNTLKNHLLPRIKTGIYRNISFDYDGITRGAHTLLIFHANKDAEEHKEDAMIFVTYAALAAEALGLGATIIGLIPPVINKEKKLKKLFNIPDNHEAVSSIIIGYPKYKYLRGIKRELKKINWIN